jgi:hypothetical protein
MRHTFTLLFLLLSCYTSFAQSRTKWNVGVSLNPLICNSINTEKTTANDPVYLHNGSINTTKSYRLNMLLPALWFNYSLDQKWSLQTGLGYQDVGFELNQNNIKYQDSLFAGIPHGIRLDKSNAVADIHYEYRFQYIQIPVLFNYLMGKSGDYRFSYSLTGGIAFNFLVKHQITANLLNGFYIDGNSSYNLSPTGYDARFFAFAMIGGGRIDYKLDKKTTLMVQPILGLYPFSVTSSPVSVYPYYFAVQTGLVYDIAN